MDDELRKAAQDAVDRYRNRMVEHVDRLELSMQVLETELANNANAAPDSSLAPQIESLIAEYWDIAYEEGKTGISQGDLANQVLGRIRNALIAWSQRAAPQDQDAKDAARYRWLRIRPADMNFLSYREAQEIDRRIDDAMEQKP